ANPGHHGVALAQVGDEARIALAEADQGLVLLLHAAHREPALAAVAPGAAGQRRQHAGGADVADALEVLQQHTLLGQDLLRFVQVLQHAAAAHAEMGAARLDAVGRGLQHLERGGLVETARTRCLAHHHPFARQRIGDEHGLAALAARHAAPVMAQVVDLEFEGRLVDPGHVSSAACGKAAHCRRCRRGAPGLAPRRPAYFCFQVPPCWYHQPGRALAIHWRANTSPTCGSHSGWPLATAALTATRSLIASLDASRTTTVPSPAKPSAPESKCGRSAEAKRDSMRDWIAWMAGVRMVMSGCACACALPMPSSIHGSKRSWRIAMPPSPGVGAGAGTASSPITFSTNSRAASRASAAGK